MFSGDNQISLEEFEKMSYVMTMPFALNTSEEDKDDLRYSPVCLDPALPCIVIELC